MKTKLLAGQAPSGAYFRPAYHRLTGSLTAGGPGGYLRLRPFNRHNISQMKHPIPIRIPIGWWVPFVVRLWNRRHLLFAISLLDGPHIGMGLGEVRDSADALNNILPRVVSSKAESEVVVKCVQQAAQILGPAFDVLICVVEVANAQARGRRRHQLHQSSRTFLGNGLRIECGLSCYNGPNQRGIKAEFMGVLLNDEIIACWGALGWGYGSWHNVGRAFICSQCGGHGVLGWNVGQNANAVFVNVRIQGLGGCMLAWAHETNHDHRKGTSSQPKRVGFEDAFHKAVKMVGG